MFRLYSVEIDTRAGLGFSGGSPCWHSIAHLPLLPNILLPRQFQGFLWLKSQTRHGSSCLGNSHPVGSRCQGNLHLQDHTGETHNNIDTNTHQYATSTFLILKGDPALIFLLSPSLPSPSPLQESQVGQVPLLLYMGWSLITIIIEV